MKICRRFPSYWMTCRPTRQPIIPAHRSVRFTNRFRRTFPKRSGCWMASTVPTNRRSTSRWLMVFGPRQSGDEQLERSCSGCSQSNGRLYSVYAERFGPSDLPRRFSRRLDLGLHHQRERLDQHGQPHMARMARFPQFGLYHASELLRTLQRRTLQKDSRYRRTQGMVGRREPRVAVDQ